MTPLLQLVEPGTTLDPHQEHHPAVGIDLGTTHSLIAVAEGQSVKILHDENGDILLPSIVAYLAEGHVVVGKGAEEALTHTPNSAIRSVKRFIGNRGNTPSPMVRLDVGERQLTPIEISADILRALKARAEKALNRTIEQAVITVPAFFDEAARAATRDAARLAGIETLRLLNEPTAAALAYGLERQMEGFYVVYDLGGGTFDVSVLRLEKGVFQVLATGGNSALGGDDFDQLIVHHMCNQHEIHPESLTPTASKKALMIARYLRETLSREASQTVSLDLDGRSTHYTLSRSTYEDLIAPLVAETLTICASAVQDARLSFEQINGVILVGGATRTPLIQQKVEGLFKQAPLCSINPDEAVVRGAALQAEALTTGSQTLLLDVTPLSLGVEMMGGVVEKIIPRNSPLPTSKSQEFTTYQEGQTGMILHIVQGERELAADCRSLAHFELKGIPALPAGMARVKVTFTIDADGLLSVTAREQMTGTMQHIDIKPSYGLTDDELKKMLEESYVYGKEDIQNRLLQETRVEAQRLLRAVERTFVLLDSTAQTKLEKPCATLRNVIPGKDREAIEHAVEKLEAAVEAIALMQ